MGLTISGSVGQRGMNRRNDVEVVQALLNRATRTKLAIDGRCGQLTIGSIKTFQSPFLKIPDGRVDLGGMTWRKLADAPSPPGPPPKPLTPTERDGSLVSAIDADPTLNGSGIVLIDATGHKSELRGGPRRQWVYISAAPLTASPPPAEKQLPTFWDRWGNTVLNCGSATATGAVIYLSGGTATLAVGAFAVNSAALCGMSLGKAIDFEVWQEFEQNGGGEFRAWLTVETLMSLADLFNGVKGAANFLKEWKQLGKLAKLEKVLAGRKLRTRAQLLKAIQEVDPKFQANLAGKGPGYYSKAKLVVAGQEVLTVNNFKSLTNQQARVIVDAIGNSLTLAGAPETWSGVKKTYALWVVQYQDKPEDQ